MQQAAAVFRAWLDARRRGEPDPLVAAAAPSGFGSEAALHQAERAAQTALRRSAANASALRHLPRGSGELALARRARETRASALQSLRAGAAAAAVVVKARPSISGSPTVAVAALVRPQ